MFFRLTQLTFCHSPKVFALFHSHAFWVVNHLFCDNPHLALLFSYLFYPLPYQKTLPLFLKWRFWKALLYMHYRHVQMCFKKTAFICKSVSKWYVGNLFSSLHHFKKNMPANSNTWLILATPWAYVSVPSSRYSSSRFTFTQHSPVKEKQKYCCDHNIFRKLLPERIV